MNFGWIKKLFNKQKNTGISTIDTSFVVVPKLSELSENNKKIVKSYIKNIDIKNYESILKYSESLVEKNNVNKELLFSKVNELKGIISTIKPIDRIKELNNNDLRKECNTTLIKCDYIKEQILLLIEEIRNNEIEAELKLIAFNEFIKKENRKKYSFSVISNKEERIKHLNLQNSLQEEKERLLIINKVIRYDLYSACSAYKSIEHNDALNNMEDYVLYIDSSSSILHPTDYCLYREVYDTTDILIGELNRIKNTLLNVNEFNNRESNVHDANAFCLFDNQKVYRYKNKEYYDILRENASLNIQLEKYAYRHRNDYKTIIKEIKEFVDRYSTTFSFLWNKDELLESIRKYTAVIVNYSIIFEKYMADDIQKELREALFNLNYFYYISRIENSESGKHDELSQRYINYNEKYLINGNHVHDILSKYNGKKWNYDDEYPYYDKLSIEMLETIEMLQLPGIEYNHLQRKNKTIASMLEYIYQDLPILFDIYNGYYNGSNVKITIPSEKDKNWLMKRIVGLSKSSSIDNNIWNNIVIENEITAENLFYLLKFFGINDYNLNHLVDTFQNSCIKLPEERNIDYIEIQKIIIKSIFYKLEKEYDKRIAVVPGNIDMSKNSSKVLSNIIERINNSNAIGVFVPNLDEIDSFVYLMYRLNNIKYLMIPKDSLSLLDGNTFRYSLADNVIKFNNKDIKIIIVDDNIEYKDLSRYLDNAMEEGKQLTKMN